MSFTVTYNDEYKCILTVLKGDLTPPVVSNFFKTVGEAAIEYNCTKVLSDLREAKIKASQEEIEEMAGKLEAMSISKQFKRAIVISVDHEDYVFWKDSCDKQGHSSVRIFSNYLEAKRWIIADNNL